MNSFVLNRALVKQKVYTHKDKPAMTCQQQFDRMMSPAYKIHLETPQKDYVPFGLFFIPLQCVVVR